MWSLVLNKWLYYKALLNKEKYLTDSAFLITSEEGGVVYGLC